MNKTLSTLERDRNNERGAALITTLLFSMLLLIAGGAVIMTTSLANTTSIDSTAEVQAYYAAEAGLQAALNVVRGNDDATNGVTTATFRNLVTNPNLSGWLTYGTSGRVNLTGTSTYAVYVTDPDNKPVGQDPDRLIVRSTGYGPKGAVKQLEMMVRRTNFDYNPPSTILLNGAGGSTPAAAGFVTGSSNAKDYTGHDAAGTGQVLPAFGLTSSGDQTIANTDIAAKPDTVEDPKTGLVANANLPTWLQNADQARAFLNLLQETADTNGRYFTTSTTDIGSATTPKMTFIDGNATVGPQDGAGLLVITGTATFKGNFNFKGLILVLGTGVLQRDGGGTMGIDGAIVVAGFNRTTAGSAFTAPVYNTSGGGNADIAYDSSWVKKGLDLSGSRVVGVREY